MTLIPCPHCRQFYNPRWLEQATCPVCGGQFDRWDRHGHQRVTCGRRECVREVQRRSLVAARARLAVHPEWRRSTA